MSEISDPANEREALIFESRTPTALATNRVSNEQDVFEMKPGRLSLANCASFLIAATAVSFGQDLEQHLHGEWEMELRILKYPGVVYYQEDASIFVNEKQPDGTFRVLARITTRAVADSEQVLLRPECEGKKECRYDDASEGVGRLINGKLFVDWVSDGWIDDVFTVSGDTMTGDDGNGPIKLTKKR